MNDDTKTFAVGIGAVILAVFIGIGLVFVMCHWLWGEDESKAKGVDAVTPVQCSCSCPEIKCPASVVADGYNVNVSVNGEKYGPPLQGEAPTSMYCRVEDVDTLDRMGPDMTLTKCWEWLDECRNDLYEVRSGFDDEANGMCWQQEVF